MRYQQSALSAQELRDELAAFFASASEDKGTQADADEAGVDLGELLEGGPGQIEVEPSEPGFTGVEEAILIKLGSMAAQKAWAKVVVPWLERRRGKAPLGKVMEGDEGEPKAG
jgi:hypothetical protein